MALQRRLPPRSVKNVIIAYEPIWAIGTGKTATDEQANEAIGVIREAVAGLYGQAVADAMPHPVRRLHERQELQQSLMAQPRDRRRPDRRRIPEGRGLLHHRRGGYQRTSHRVIEVGDIHDEKT